MKAVILHRLNFRSSPGIRDNWLRTNIPGTQAEVVGGPECILYWTGAYVWWQIKLPDGRVGWSAEASFAWLVLFYGTESVRRVGNPQHVGLPARPTPVPSKTPTPFD